MSLRRNRPPRTAALCICCIALVPGGIRAQPGPDDSFGSQVSRRLENELTERGYPSLSLAIVHRDDIVYLGAAGVANRAASQPATPDTLYRIASITKVFTATLMVSLRDDGIIRLDDPVAKYLPDHVTLPSDPRGAPAITLRHLATHTSGLPHDPVNLTARGGDPWAGYTLAALYEGLPKTTLVAPIGSRDHYSNIGVGLLGHALARAANQPYERLLKQRILDPLRLRNTAIVSSLSTAQRDALAIGYTAQDTHVEAVDWDLGCIDPAGGLASSARDMARFLSFQFRAGQAQVRPVRGSSLLEMQMPQYITPQWDGGRGLGWIVWRDDTYGNLVRHAGGMDGFASSACFYPRYEVGVIVMTNCGKSVEKIARDLLVDAVKKYGSEPQPALQQIAHALAEYIVADPPDALAELFQPSFLEQFPLSLVQDELRRIHNAYGKCENVLVRRGWRPEDGKIEFSFASGKTVKCELRIDNSDSAKLVRLYFPED